MPAIDRRTGVAIEMLVIAVLVRFMALALVPVGMEIVEIAIVDVSAQWRIVHRKADPAFQASDAEFQVTLVPPAETIGLTLKPARLLAQLLRFLSADRAALTQHVDPAVEVRDARPEQDREDVATGIVVHGSGRMNLMSLRHCRNGRAGCCGRKKRDKKRAVQRRFHSNGLRHCP